MQESEHTCNLFKAFQRLCFASCVLRFACLYHLHMPLVCVTPLISFHAPPPSQQATVWFPFWHVTAFHYHRKNSLSIYWLNWAVKSTRVQRIFQKSCSIESFQWFIQYIVYYQKTEFKLWSLNYNLYFMYWKYYFQMNFRRDQIKRRSLH